MHLARNWHHVGTHYLSPFPDWNKSGQGESSAPSWCFACTQHFASLSSCILRYLTRYRMSKAEGYRHSRRTGIREAIFTVALASLPATPIGWKPIPRQSPKEMSTSRAVCTSSPFGGTSFKRLT